ncbi:MAG: PKD domain-containing protein, partial [Dehalococcoidia bacterium]|nr:PKD domain-containing protein [Dehalococcoidia bacterium]
GNSASCSFADNGSFSVNVRVNDGDGGVVTSSTVVTVDNVVPTVNAGPDATINEGSTFSGSGSFTDPGADTWTATVNYGDGSGVQALTLSGKTFSLSHVYADNGSFTVNVCVTDDDGGNGCDTAAVTVNNVAPTVTNNLATQSVQYSDPIGNVTVTAKDVAADTGLTAATSWSKDGGASTPGLPGGIAGITPPGAGACSTNGVVATCTWTVGGKALVAPGTYTVTVEVTDKDGGAGSTAFTIVVTQEDARTTYTGAMFAATASTTSSSATVTLAATVQDITAVDPTGDPDPGDIRKAMVTFVNRDASSAVLCTASVGLVNPADTKTGTATCNWNATITGDSQSFTVGVIVNNYYTRNDSADNDVVTVSKPLTSNFITGGGYLALTNSSGLKAGDAGKKNNFGFNVKYNKSGTNLQGNMNTIIRRTESDGLHVYQIKGNAMTSLTVNPSLCPKATSAAPCTAVFNGKANIQDITNPSAPVSVDGNATLQVTMTDKGEPGSSDSISITVWNKAGGLWFASKWDGVKTVEQLLGGGNLVVH